MDSQTFNLVMLIVSIVSFVIFYYLIKSAVSSGTERQRRFIEGQTRLLIEIARKQGVEEDKIVDIQKRLN